jgi:hypothetical protein
MAASKLMGLSKVVKVQTVSGSLSHPKDDWHGACVPTQRQRNQAWYDGTVFNSVASILLRPFLDVSAAQAFERLLVAANLRGGDHAHPASGANRSGWAIRHRQFIDAARKIKYRNTTGGMADMSFRRGSTTG